jgi:hypothetical protein
MTAAEFEFGPQYQYQPHSNVASLMLFFLILTQIVITRIMQVFMVAWAWCPYT